MMMRKVCLFFALLLAVASWRAEAQVPDADTLRQAAQGQVGGYLNDYFCGDGSTSEFIDTLDENSGLGSGRGATFLNSVIGFFFELGYRAGTGTGGPLEDLGWGCRK
mmetsp:Transcript_4758/g.11434  ORF Transcript_4758/g.11434 Transcript_4758/m.11434 type:complete len:107 (-) Transcript_4758:179-499(-)